MASHGIPWHPSPKGWSYLPRLLLGMVGLLGSSCLQLLAPPLVSAALMAAERGAKAAQARQRGSTTGLGHSEATNGCIHFWEIGLWPRPTMSRWSLRFRLSDSDWFFGCQYLLGLWNRNADLDLGRYFLAGGHGDIFGLGFDLSGCRW